MSRIYFPTQKDLCDATIQAIKNLGGIAGTQAINEEVVKILHIPEEVVNLEDDSGLGTRLDYRLRWCKTELKSKHKIMNIKRGTWAIENE